MGVKVGDMVLVAGREVLVESIYKVGEDGFVCVLRPDGHRMVWDVKHVEPVPVDDTVEREKKFRRKLVDRILEYKGTPRTWLFEYPYRADESQAIIKKAEKLLDDLIQMIEEGVI